MSKTMIIKDKKYWRSFDQMENPRFFYQKHKYEFREGASELPSMISRRNFLSLVSASVALAGLTACRKPVEKIIPYVKAPEEQIPGIAKHYATSMPFMTSAYGLVVENHEGRPTKIEGNTLHPSSKGGSNLQMQAAILDLYDPDRAQYVVHDGVEKSRTDFSDFWQALYPELFSNRGNGLAVLSESFSSPTLYRLKNEFQKTFPRAQWASYEAVSDESIIAGFQMATGLPGLPRYHMAKARVIAVFDADFIQCESENIINTQEFTKGRNIEMPDIQMSRLYVAEPAFTVSGGMADHRLPVTGSRTGLLVVALADLLNINMAASELACGLSEKENRWLQALATDLKKNRGRSLILAGRRQPPWVHALIYLINERLNNNGITCGWYPLTDKSISQLEELRQLTVKIKTNEIKTMIILGGNPVYNAPADFQFNTLLKNVPTTIHLSYDLNETAKQANWYLPRTHFLESWGDARATDGSLSVIQPLIAPLFDDCRSIFETLALITSGTESGGYELVRSTWKSFLANSDFENQWRQVLHDGILAESHLKTITIKSRNDVSEQIANAFKTDQDKNRDALELALQMSPSLFDGRYANNGWLQELPDSVSKLTWDNAALLSKTTADQFGIENEDIITLKHHNHILNLPAWILPGHVDNSITVHLGYGRTVAGRIGTQIGRNGYKLRLSESQYFISDIKVLKTGQKYSMACTQDHGSMEGRPLVREASLDEYRRHPDFANEMVEHPPLVSLWQEQTYEQGYQWGMAIDLNACVGCNVCVIACQSENNVPIVGKEQVGHGREMHWLRLDRYFSGDAESAEMVTQPVACQHCENAPCEQVCPVAATVHDKEGLNLMTYNRCIGTRYCSNNCPYKVRRFNFFNYTKDLPEIVQLGQNPDVTVRSRGVMEKCTYCLQRINAAKITAKNAGRELGDSELQTACQQACPANAIIFGNINDPNSAVSRIKKSNRNYEMLAELNIKPRTSYLAKIRNPNPDMEEESSD
jgi:MoCo/4Fe-4S cofactor protein with predicted Tat translocation signal